MSTIIKDYEPEVRSLFHTLKNHGFTLVSVSNGDGPVSLKKLEDGTSYMSATYQGVKPYDAFVAEALAADEFDLKVEKDGKKFLLYCVLGNSPGELVADWTDAPDLNKAAAEHSDRWDGKPQPTKEL